MIFFAPAGWENADISDVFQPFLDKIAILCGFAAQERQKNKTASRDAVFVFSVDREIERVNDVRVELNTEPVFSCGDS